MKLIPTRLAPRLSSRPLSIKTLPVLDLILFLSLILAATRVGSGLELFKDLEMPDESNYLHLGRHFFSVLRPPADAAPLYSLWYNILSYFRRDPIDLFYLNARLTVALPALLVFLLLRARRVSAEAAAFVVFLFLISPSNVLVWPRVTHFALCVMLAGFALASRVVSPARKTLLLSLAALLASYCRPEFYLAFLGLAALWPFTLLRHPRAWPPRRELRELIFFLISAGALHAFFGRPMFGGEGRSFFAFGQHYALNYVVRTKAGLSPWTDWPQLMAREFGAGVHTVGQALAARPDLFRQHVLMNLDYFGLTFWESLRKLLVPIWPPVWMLTWQTLLAGATVAGYLFFVLRLRGIRLAAAGAAVREWFSLDELLRVLVVIAPSLLGCLIIYPRWHYLLPLATVPLIALTVLGSRLAASRAPSSQPQPVTPTWIKCTTAAIVALIILPLTPTAIDYTHDTMERVSTIRLIRTIKIKGEIGLLEGDGTYMAYLPWYYRPVLYYAKNEPFYDFSQKNHLGLIKTDPQIIWDSKYRDDPQWREFLKDPSSHGFITLPVPHTGKALLVRRSVLDEEI